MRKPVRCHAARTLLSQACVSSDGWGDEEAFVVIVLCIQVQRSQQVRRTTVVSAYTMDIGRPQGPPQQALHHGALARMRWSNRQEGQVTCSLNRNRQTALHLSRDAGTATGENLALRRQVLLQALDILVVRDDAQLGEFTLAAARTRPT